MEDEPPVVCEPCLGDSSSIRMTKAKNGAQCKICTLPYTLYHFKPHSRDASLTKTVICRRCATQRNICQCCMLDMVWHISVQLRDQMLAMIQKDRSNVTEEAQNDMMKRFLALKDVKLGGARITSDPSAIQGVLGKLEQVLTSQPVSIEAKASGDSNALERFKQYDISRVLRKLPLKDSLDGATPCKSFFLFNVDASIPEWKISKAITDTVNNEQWQDRATTAVIVNHKAKCGGIRFKSEELGQKFAESLQSSGSTFKTAGNLQRGVLKIAHFRVFVIPWASGFSTSSFGASVGENIKLSLSMDKLIKLETVSAGQSTAAAPAPAGKIKKNKVTKKRQSSRRVQNLEL